MNTHPLADGLFSVSNADDFTIVIFGVTGDLTRKKLVPALYSLFSHGYITNFKVIGFARRDWSDDYLREIADNAIGSRDIEDDDRKVRNEFLGHFYYHQSTFEDLDGYKSLRQKLSGGTLFYLAAPPGAYQQIIENIHASNLHNAPERYSRIVIEKPFGRDLATAKELNSLLSRCFSEDDIYRIDHYLGKETVQNLMTLRFGNSIFEPLWNSYQIDHVQITVAEDIGIGTRGNYYEKSGALRDMVQNHVFQLLCLTAMEAPPELDADSIRTEKMKVMKSLRPITHKNVDQYTVRGQYDKGIASGEKAAAYRDEDDVDQDSSVETYAALKVFIDNWRWSGVPFYLRTGKRLPRRLSEIAIAFKQPPHQLYKSQRPDLSQNKLIIRIQPDEGVTFSLNTKIPGHVKTTRPVNMNFAYESAFTEPLPEAYERLILDALKGDSTLYPRRDEIELSWSFITRILSGWSEDRTPLELYAAGSQGPDAARDLIEDDNRAWRRL